MCVWCLYLHSLACVRMVLHYMTYALLVQRHKDHEHHKEIRAVNEEEDVPSLSGQLALELVHQGLQGGGKKEV